MLLKSDLPLVRACSNRDNQPASGQGNHQSGDSASAEGQLFSAVHFSELQLGRKLTAERILSEINHL